MVDIIFKYIEYIFKCIEYIFKNKLNQSNCPKLENFNWKN